jgi:hypothetical protein
MEYPFAEGSLMQSLRIIPVFANADQGEQKATACATGIRWRFRNDAENEKFRDLAPAGFFGGAGFDDQFQSVAHVDATFYECPQIAIATICKDSFEQHVKFIEIQATQQQPGAGLERKARRLCVVGEHLHRIEREVV